MTASTKRRPGNGAGAVMLFAAVGFLALPSAVLAFANHFDSPASAPLVSEGGFEPAEVDPRLARSITVRALSKDRTFRFTPAAGPTRPDGAVTVAVRVDSRAFAALGLRPSAQPEAAQSQPGGLGIAPTVYSLGAARGYRSFANNTAAPVGPRANLPVMPDLAAYQPKQSAVPAKTSRFAPQLELDEREKTGRSPRTFEQSDQTVGVGGSYRVTRNLNVTAGVRVTSDRDRLVPLTDGKQDNQAVYVGTQFRF
ncbi:MAG: hypothetical protein ACKOPM_12815 [Novosphingobium sp.]